MHLFFPVFSTSSLKIEKYFGALAVKIIYYIHLASVVFYRFLRSFFLFFKVSTTWYLPIYAPPARLWMTVRFAVSWLDLHTKVEELVPLVRCFALSGK